MPLPSNLDSPYFPQELEQIIFTLSAQTSTSNDLASQRLVCRRAKSWVDPFRFRVLSLTWFAAWSTLHEYRDFLLSLPPEVLCSSVQRIWLGTSSPQDLEILFRCEQITHLALIDTKHKVPDLSDYANLQRLSLIHVTADDLFNRMRRHRKHKPFLSLTHFQVFGSNNHGLDADWIGEFRIAMPKFPALTHFMLEYIVGLGGSDWKDLRSIASLDQMIMVVILKSPPPPSSSQRQEPLDPVFVRHDKVVVLDWECGRGRQDWDNSCIGKADAWDVAEDIMRKRAEELEG